MKTIYKICSKYLFIPKEEQEALKKYLREVEKIGRSEQIKEELEEFLEDRNYETKGYVFAKLQETINTS